MKQCQEIMSQMASCSKAFENRADDAEQKLREYMKLHEPQIEPPSNSVGEETEAGKPPKSGRRTVKLKGGESEEATASEVDIRKKAAAALRRSKGGQEDDDSGRVGRKVRTVR